MQLILEQSHFKTKETFGHTHSDVACHAIGRHWTVNPQKFSIVLRIKDKSNQSIVANRRLDEIHAGLKKAKVVERFGAEFWRDITIVHSESN